VTMRYWLMKSEPSTYSIDDLKKDGKTYWDGVRNFQARNFMRDDMRAGDLVLFYHSNAEPSGVAGLARVYKTGYPDFTAKSTKEKSLWFMVDMEFVKKFERLVPLEELKRNPALKGMWVIKRGTRLSVQPVEKKHFETIKKMGNIS